MDKSIKNSTLMETVLNRIQKHPAKWDQRKIISGCGEKFCFAALAIMECGHDLSFRKSRYGRKDYYLDGSKIDPTDLVGFAASLLGLSLKEEIYYLAGTATLYELMQMPSGIMPDRKRRH